MASHFKTLREAKKEYKIRTGVPYELSHTTLSPVRIFNRNKFRRGRKQRLLKKPYFVGSQLEWLNL